jgi:hypothetical protein
MVLIKISGFDHMKFLWQKTSFFTIKIMCSVERVFKYLETGYDLSRVVLSRTGPPWCVCQGVQDYSFRVGSGLACSGQERIRDSDGGLYFFE